MENICLIMCIQSEFVYFFLLPKSENNGGWVEAGHQRPRVAPGIVLQSLFGHSKGVFQTEIYVNVFGNILS